MIGLANACSSYHLGMVFTTNFWQDSVLWMGRHQFCHVGPGYRPIVMQKTTGGNQQSAFAKLCFWGSCLCTKLRYVLCHRGPLQGRISFHDQSLKCNARVLLPPFQYLSITLSSASSAFSIWGCAGPWGGVVWPNQWNLIISHIFPINDHSTAAIPLFHLETAWRRR